VTDRTSAAEAAALGEGLVAAGSRVALLVMGDGSAYGTEAAPRGFDERAAVVADDVVRALCSGDAAGLLAIDPALGRELAIAGRASWQVLTGALGASRWSARTGMNSAPFGVRYLVARVVPG